MLTDEQREKLTQEQVAIAEKWQEESEKCHQIYIEMDTAISNGDHDAYDVAAEKLTDIVPSVCEHGESVFNQCMECDAIERVIRPELFDEEGQRIYPLEEDLLSCCTIT